MPHSILIIFAVVFVLLNAFFVAAEFAMVKLRYTRVQILKDSAGWRGHILSKVHEQLDSYLSACQLGITLSSLALGWIGEPAFADVVTLLLQHVGITSQKMIDFVSFTFAFFSITFLHIVIGELMPKTVAIRQSEKVSLWTAAPLYWFYWLMYPAIYLLNGCSQILLKIFKLDAQHAQEFSYSSSEIKLILKSSHIHGELEKDEADIIHQTLDFADLKVKDMMYPVQNLIALDNHHSLNENISKMIKYGYSRYPIYEGSIKNIIGIVHTKDYLAVATKSNKQPQLTEIMRTPIKISPNHSSLELLQKFKTGSTHMGLVYQKDELIGFLTLDNLMQIILGSNMLEEFKQ